MTKAKKFFLRKALGMICFAVTFLIIAFSFKNYIKKYLKLKPGPIFDASVVGNSQGGKVTFDD